MRYQQIARSKLPIFPIALAVIASGLAMALRSELSSTAARAAVAGVAGCMLAIGLIWARKRG